MAAKLKASYTSVENSEREITEKKRAEIEQFRLLNIVEKSLNEIYIFDSETLKFDYVNQGALQNSGYTLSEMRNMTPLDIKPEFTEAMFREMVRPLINQEKERLVFESLHRRKDGTYYPVEVYLQLNRQDDKSVFFAVINDITERKKAEEKLRQSERNLAEAERIGNTGSWDYDVASDTAVWSENMFRIFDVDRELPKELVFKQFVETLVHPADRTHILSALQDALTGKRPYDLEYRIVKKDGSIRHIHALAETLRDEQGKVIRMIGKVEDITDRKHLETQLRHAQKMDAVGALAGGIAHDLNNILNVIIGYGTMVMNTMEADSVSKGRMNEVLAAAERAAVLTKRLLTFSRKQLDEVKPIDINESVIGIRKLLAGIIGEDIDFQLDLENRNLVVMADAGQIEQVLMNLVANARDAMPNGGRLMIGTGLQEIDDEYIAANGYGTPGVYALITVADTGCGMDTETQKKIFEPFYTTKSMGEGTGLGLAISYGIIKQYNGYIKVYSEPGNGTLFKIYLPLLEEAASLEKKTEASVSVKGGNETVLVAEDDASMRKLTRIVLESFGYSVITAEDGEDAITKFMENRDRIDLAVLDMIMPKMNGKEVSEALRKMNPRIKIFFVSGYTMAIIKNKELTESGFDFIHKPIRPQDLLIKVREVLDK